MTSRRDFLRFSTGIGAASIGGAALGQDAVYREMQRRLGYLAAPDGSPPDLLAHPSPPVDPWLTVPLEELRPPVARPLFRMDGPVTAAEALALGFSAAEAATAVEDLAEAVWLRLFAHRFGAAAAALAADGFRIPFAAASGWTVRGDRVAGDRVRIDIGEPPDPSAHQRFREFRPRAFYINREAEFLWRFHPQYGDESSSWGYHNIYFDAEAGDYAATRPCSPGTTFKARYGEPIIVRRINDLPEIGNQPGHSKLRFALPSSTSHLHNAHTASESDGYPNDWLNPGEYWDHHYANFPSGFDDREKLSTLWYHDHRMDFTATNVYAGLDGFYLLFDERAENGAAPDTGDHDDETIGWRLPSGDHDIPLIFHDLLFAQEIAAHGPDGAPLTGRDGAPLRVANPVSPAQTTRWTFDSAQDWDALEPGDMRGRALAEGGPRRAIRHRGFPAGDAPGVAAGRYQPSPEVVFDGFNIDGVIGDRWSVNRRVQPRLKVKPRKYRLRLLNGGPSRFYEFSLHATNVSDDYRSVFGDDAPSETTRTQRQMLVITGDGNFQPNPVIVDSVYVGVAQRVDVIVDFAAFGPGAHVCLVNTLEQENGRGPTERSINSRDYYASDEDFFKANGQILFEVEDEAVADDSRFPLFFRDLPPVDFSEVKRERLWEFDYDGGLWTINGDIYDPNRIDAGIEQDSAEIWTFRNGGSGWHHPIHSHFTEFIILELDGKPFSQGAIQSQLEPPPTTTPDEMRVMGFEAAPAETVEPAMRPEPVTGFSTSAALRAAFRTPADPDALNAALDAMLAAPATRDAAVGAVFDGVAAEAYRERMRPVIERRHPADAESRLDASLAAARDAVIAAFGKFKTVEAVDDVLRPLVADAAQRVKFRAVTDFYAFTSVLKAVGLSSPELPEPRRFLGGPRRDVALLRPNTEVTVFMRWKDFMGRHVMHCHNVVHEDHAMMIRWDIVPRGQGFDRPRPADAVAAIGDAVSPHRRKHIEVHPPGGAHQPDDS